jgi:predicted peroxiredoxin
MRLLVHIATGPENPTRIALGLLVARAACDDGHEVVVFLAGDAVDAFLPETREAMHGVGTGSVSEHWTALLGSGARIFGSQLSSQARAIAAPEGVELVLPSGLVKLIAEADRVISY